VTAFGYPVSLDLRGKVAVVAGELAVREGKPDGLRAAGASVLVVSSRPVGELDRLDAVDDDDLVVERRGWRPGDLDGAFLLVASSRDPGERSRLYAEARARRVLANVMDDVEHCDWAAPAVVRRGRLVLAVSTGGASPAVARAVREELEERYGPEWGEVLEVLASVREETFTAFGSYAERARAWRSALNIEETERLVREGRAGEAALRTRRRLLEHAERSA
jgi:precorrin-2 dehydrogenase/sirohydrochlorin ferrochelatase